MKDIICIICPNSCVLHTEAEGDELKVTGARCKRGIEYAYQELKNPMRSLCTTMRTELSDFPVISVRTNGAIEKNRIFETMNEINQYILNKRVHSGEIVIENIAGTNVDLIATTEMFQ